MQLVCLSIRPVVAAETLVLARECMPWIDRVVMITPERAGAEMREVASAASQDVELLFDEELLDSRTATVTHHQIRNFALRCAFGSTSAAEAEFVMADDDTRPMVPIARSYFVDEEGRHRWYRFGDLHDHLPTGTEFDEGQHATAAMLERLGAPTDATAVHAPQIFDRDLWRAVADHVRTVVDPATTPLCEWSTYANVGRLLEPERFAPVETYRTLAWPNNPAAFTAAYDADDPVFENTYPEHYRRGEVFVGLPRASADPAVRAEKLVRWAEYAEDVKSKRRVPAEITGWPRTRFRLRRALQRVARPVPALHRRFQR